VGCVEGPEVDSSGGELESAVVSAVTVKVAAEVGALVQGVIVGEEEGAGVVVDWLLLLLKTS